MYAIGGIEYKGQACAAIQIPSRDLQGIGWLQLVRVQSEATAITHWYTLHIFLHSHY